MGREQKGEAMGAILEGGTIISIEDLFYNVPTRRKTIKNTNEEGRKIMEVCIDKTSMKFLRYFG